MMAAAHRRFACPYCRESQGAQKALLTHLLDSHAWGLVSSEDSRRRADADPVRAYYEEASRRKLLNAPAEAALAVEIRRKGPRADEAKKFLTESNLRLVVSMASATRADQSRMLDLIQDGNVGLMRAVELFDPGRGFRFSTYATWWIKQAMSRGASGISTVRVPEPYVYKARKARRLLEAGQSIEEAALAVRLRPATLQDLLHKASRRTVSMDRTRIGGDGDDVLGSVLPARAERERVLPPDELAGVLGVLTPKQRHIIARRFGLDGRPDATLSEVARELGNSRERIRQIEADALRILRKGRIRKGIRVAIQDPGPAGGLAGEETEMEGTSMANTDEACAKGCGLEVFKSGAGKSAHERHCSGRRRAVAESPRKQKRGIPPPSRDAGARTAAAPSGGALILAVDRVPEHLEGTPVGETISLLIARREFLRDEAAKVNDAISTIVREATPSSAVAEPLFRKVK